MERSDREEKDLEVKDEEGKQLSEEGNKGRN